MACYIIRAKDERSFFCAVLLLCIILAEADINESFVFPVSALFLSQYMKKTGEKTARLI